MATGTYAMITNLGLNKINSSDTDGVYIEVAYYVPVYDWRIDSDINNLYADGNAMKGSGYQVSSCTSPYDVVPSGIVYWNIASDDTYTYTDTVYVLSASTTTTDSNSIFDAKQSSYTTMTTVSNGTMPTSYGVTPTWAFISMNGTITVSATAEVADFDVGAGTVSDVSMLSIGPDDVDAFDPDAYLYRGVSYNEVVTSGTDSRANFRVSVKAPKGVVKFNKLGLYAVQRTSNSDIVGNPFLFGQVVFPETQIVNTELTSIEGQIGELIVDFQMDVQAADRDFADVMYATSADYWQQVSDITGDDSDGLFGMSYSGNVYITNTLAVDDKNFYFNTSADRGIAKTLIATFEKVNAINPSREKDMPQLCLQYVAARSGSIPSKRLRTTFMTTSAGDCVVDFYGQCGTTEQNSALRPYENDQFDVGTTNYRWRRLYATNASIGQAITSINPHQGEVTFNMATSGSAVSIKNANISVNHGTAAAATTNDYYFKGNLAQLDLMTPLIIRSNVTSNRKIFIDTRNNSAVDDASIKLSIRDKFTYTSWFDGYDNTTYINSDVALAGKIILGGYIPTDGTAIDGIVPNADNTISLGSYDNGRYTTIRRFQRVITGYIGSYTPIDNSNADSDDQRTNALKIGNHVLPSIKGCIDIGKNMQYGVGLFRNANFSGIGHFGASVETAILNVGGGSNSQGTTINSGTIDTKVLNIPFTNTDVIPTFVDDKTIINAGGITAPYIHVGRLVADSVDVYKEIYGATNMGSDTNSPSKWTAYSGTGAKNGNWIVPFFNNSANLIKAYSTNFEFPSLRDIDDGVITASLSRSIFSPDSYKLSFPSLASIAIPMGIASWQGGGNDNTDSIYGGTDDYKIVDFVASCVRCFGNNRGIASNVISVDSAQYCNPIAFAIIIDSGNSAFHYDDADAVAVEFVMHVDTMGVLHVNPYKSDGSSPGNFKSHNTPVPNAKASITSFDIYFNCGISLV